MVTTKDPKPTIVERRSRSHLTMSYSYANNTKSSMTIVRRDGTADILPPKLSKDFAKGTFDITYTVEGDRDVIHNYLLDSERSTAMRKLMTELLEKGIRNNNSISISYSIPYKEVETDGTIYLLMCDILLSIEPLDEIPDHPGWKDRLPEALMVPDGEYTSFRIVHVVENKNAIQYYLGIGGSIMPIRNSVCVGVPPGIYYSYNDDDGPHIFSLEEEEYLSYGIYETAQAARLGFKDGAACEARLKKEEEKLKQTISEYEAAITETAKVKDSFIAKLKQVDLHAEQLHEHRLRKLDLEKRVVDYELKYAEHELKMDELAAKGAIDTTASKVKSSNEWAKTIPGILSVAKATSGIISGVMYP